MLKTPFLKIKNTYKTLDNLPFLAFLSYFRHNNSKLKKEFHYEH